MARTRWMAAAVGAWLVAASAAAAQPEERVAPRLRAALQQAAPGETQLVWVFLRDKPTLERDAERAPGRRATARALARRAQRGRPSAAHAFEDRPVSPDYARAVARVARVRHVARWFNAISAEADADGVQALAALPFVVRLDLLLTLAE